MLTADGKTDPLQGVNHPCLAGPEGPRIRVPEVDDDSIIQGQSRGMFDLITLDMRLLSLVRGSENGEPRDHFMPASCALLA